MLEAFRILEEEKHINKEDIIDAVKEMPIPAACLQPKYSELYHPPLHS